LFNPGENVYLAEPAADYIVPKVIGGKTGDSSGFIMLDAL